MKFIEENPEKRKLKQNLIHMMYKHAHNPPNKNDLYIYIKNNNILDLEIIEYGLKFIEELKEKHKLKYPDIEFKEDNINIKEETTKIILSIICDKTKEIRDTIQKVKVYAEKNKSEIKKVKIK